jgi:hypothetical protein
MISKIKDRLDIDQREFSALQIHAAQNGLLLDLEFRLGSHTSVIWKANSPMPWAWEYVLNMRADEYENLKGIENANEIDK